MADKFKNQSVVIILIVIAAAIFIGCGASRPTLVGTWKRTDREVGMTNTFTADGDYIIKSASGEIRGKYELNGSNLRVYYPESKGKDSNLEIFKLEDNLLILASDNHGEKTYSKLERVGY